MEFGEGEAGELGGGYESVYWEGRAVLVCQAEGL